MREQEQDISKTELNDQFEPSLSDEEIAFLRNQVETVTKTGRGRDFSLATKAISEANWLADHPELGMQETESAKFLTRRLSSILGQENVGQVGGGVYGILEGDQEDGATIFLRGDMDALPLTKDKAAHMCGHNIHMAWLLENARLLTAYREHFKNLPLKRIVFLGEPNEEGIASPEFGPQEMINAGLIEKTGKPDFILGAHFVAPQPEGEVRLDQETACYSDGRFHYSLIPQDENQDVKMLEYEFIYQVGQTWESENPNSDFGRLSIVDDCQSATPETMVRVTDSKLISEERHLRPNILSAQEEVELDLSDLENSEAIEATIQNIQTRWNEVKITTQLNNQSLKISIQSKGGHVAQGGPNVKYIMAELLHDLKEKQNFSIKNGNQGLEMVGSLRTRARDWKGEGHKIGKVLHRIINQIVARNGAGVKVQGDMPEIDNPPVYNDDKMRNSALKILNRAGVPITTMGMPIAPAETFAFWESELGIPGLYISIGGGDKDELEDIKKNKLPVPEKYIHHAPAILDLIRANRAIPYGAVMSLIALEIGKQYQKS